MHSLGTVSSPSSKLTSLPPLVRETAWKAVSNSGISNERHNEQTRKSVVIKDATATIWHHGCQRCARFRTATMEGIHLTRRREASPLLDAAIIGCCSGASKGCASMTIGPSSKPSMPRRRRRKGRVRRSAAHCGAEARQRCVRGARPLTASSPRKPKAR